MRVGGQKHLNSSLSPDGDGIEPVVRVRARGTPDFDLLHEFAKPESEGARFGRGLRASIAWLFDGRTRDPGRQLAFYQGGVLDRLFGDADLHPALALLRTALDSGADGINQDPAVLGVLDGLAEDMRGLGLLDGQAVPLFEVGPVSRRELLQSLRLSVGEQNLPIPLFRQGRGTQRLLLVAALTRLARMPGTPIVGAFEEPEEALEPLRQTQIAEMLRSLAAGGQVFVVTHSPEIVRAFEVDDLVLLPAPGAGTGARPLNRVLSPEVRQAYERNLDGAVVRGLFAKIPILVEGPSDRGVMSVFWSALGKAGSSPPAAHLGVDLINCEGVTLMPMLAQLLHRAGKEVVAWVDQDSSEAVAVVERLRQARHCGALLLHDPSPGRQNLEEALAADCTLGGLAAGLGAIAEDRGYQWPSQRDDLMSRLEVPSDIRERARTARSIPEMFDAIGEVAARGLAARALLSKKVTPFEMKGARQGRVFAMAVVDTDGVPPSFKRAIQEVVRWIEDGTPHGSELEMAAQDAPTN